MQKEFIRKLVDLLEQKTATYAITGSIASNHWGVPRFTHDLDVLVVLNLDQACAIAASFTTDPYYASEEAAKDAVRTRSMFNLVDTSTTFKADLWVSSGDAFSQSMLSRRRRVGIISGLEAYLGSPEDVLLHKLVWNKITPSERQLGDAAGIVAVQAGNLDLDYLRTWAAQQGTADVLEEALEGKYLKET